GLANAVDHLRETASGPRHLTEFGYAAVVDRNDDDVAAHRVTAQFVARDLESRVDGRKQFQDSAQDADAEGGNQDPQVALAPGIGWLAPRYGQFLGHAGYFIGNPLAKWKFGWGLNRRNAAADGEVP